LVLQHIVPFAVTILQNDKYDNPVRQASAQMLMTLVENRPKLIAKKDLIGPVLTCLIEMVAKSSGDAAGALFCFNQDEPKTGDDEDEDYDPDEEEEINIDRTIQTLVDTMAISIPSKFFLPIALQLCAQGMNAPDPQMRKAGCASKKIL
jgi:hypothetical protein